MRVGGIEGRGIWLEGNNCLMENKFASLGGKVAGKAFQEWMNKCLKNMKYHFTYFLSPLKQLLKVITP